MSVPLPLDWRSPSTNARDVAPAFGSVAVVQRLVPVSDAEPRCTFTSAPLENSTTCHATMWVAAAPGVRNCTFEVLVRSTTSVSLLSQLLSVAVAVFDHVTKACDVAATGVIGTSTVVALWVASPRCTLMPQEYSTTDHSIVIVDTS